MVRIRSIIAKPLKSGLRKAKGAKVLSTTPASYRRRGGSQLMSTWVTPEEMDRKRKRNKIFLYVSFPILAILISAATTLLANNL